MLISHFWRVRLTTEESRLIFKSSKVVLPWEADGVGKEAARASRPRLTTALRPKQDWLDPEPPTLEGPKFPHTHTE